MYGACAEGLPHSSLSAWLLACCLAEIRELVHFHVAAVSVHGLQEVDLGENVQAELVRRLEVQAGSQQVYAARSAGLSHSSLSARFPVYRLAEVGELVHFYVDAVSVQRSVLGRMSG